MKKISSLLLALLIAAMSFGAIPASAEFTSDDIVITPDVYNIKVTVMAENSGTMTARLTSGDGENLYAMKSDRMPETVTVGTSTEYKYEFSFRMSADVPTDTYKVTVGNNVAKTEKTFPYVRLGDKIDFYNTLDTKAAGEITQFFANNSSMVPVDLAFYNTLTPDHEAVLALVNGEIANLSLATGVLETDSDAQKIEKISAIDVRFAEKFAELMEVAKIAAVTEADWENLTSELLGTVFDNHFYDGQIMDTAVLLSADVYDNFKKEAALVSEFTKDAYSKAFAFATLTEIEQTRSFGVLKDAFVYFGSEEKNIIELDANIKALIASDKDAELWKQIIDMENTNSVDLLENAGTIAANLNQSDPNSGNGSTGGSSTPADKPTGSGGGGSMGGGGGSSKPAEPKPEEPETPVTPAGAFTDIANVDWAKESINALAEKGVISGRGDGKFYPGDTVTREEFVKTIISGFDLLNEDAKADFGDVDPTRWSYAFIATANEFGIVTGDGASFNPAGRMTRQDMAVVIYRTAQKLGLELSGDAIEFDDAEAISDYAKKAVEALTAAGVINGMGDGTFAPEFTVTRAQMAKVIYGLMVLVGGGK